MRSPGRSTRRSPPWRSAVRWSVPAQRAAARSRPPTRCSAAPRSVRALVHDRRLLAEVEGLAASLTDVAAIEARSIDGASTPAEAGPTTRRLEAANAAVVRLKDAVWSVDEGPHPHRPAVADLAGSEPELGRHRGLHVDPTGAVGHRPARGAGRDSAGLHVLVRGHGLDVDSPAVAGLIGRRADDPLFRSGTVRVVDGCLSLVYKAAAEIGELGDNTRALRDAIEADDLLRLALTHEDAVAVGAGSHPLGLGRHHLPAQRPPGRQHRGGPAHGPYVVAALNGDVDNFADLKDADGLDIAPEITTDAKVIPTLVARRVAEGDAWSTPSAARWPASRGRSPSEPRASPSPTASCWPCAAAARRSTSAWPTAPTSWPASPTAWSRSPTRYLRLDGETPANPDNPTASRGQIVASTAAGRHARRHRAGGLRRHPAARRPRTS